MYVGPVRRRLGADDDFFEAGNVQRALLCKLSVFRQDEEEDSTAMMSAFEDDHPRYECMFQDCGAKFSSLKRVRVGVSLVLSVVPIFHCCTKYGRKCKDNFILIFLHQQSLHFRPKWYSCTYKQP